MAGASSDAGSAGGAGGASGAGSASLAATERLYEEDSYLQDCEARVVAAEPGRVRLDRTILYAEGGGQPGDRGWLKEEGGAEHIVSDTRKAPGNPSALWHFLENGEARLPVGALVRVRVDWPRRHRLMRLHTAMHLLCSEVEGDVTGGNIGENRARLDFNLPGGPPEKEPLNAALAALIERDLEVSRLWVDEAELDAKPELVRTMSVQPPRGEGRVRLIRVEGADLQPCGGTHVRRTGEIGGIFVSKIENKGRMNRRFHLRLPPEEAA